MGIKLSKVLIKDYKSIDCLLVCIDGKSLFFGKNNAGKSSILSAIYLGLTYDSITKEDIHVSKSKPFSYERMVTIDLLFEPDDGNLFSSDWMVELGRNIRLDPLSRKQFFAFETTISYDEKRDDYINNKTVIAKWDDKGEHEFGSALPSQILGYSLRVLYLPANRDVSLDMRDRKSIWQKMMKKINITDESKEKIENDIDKINKSIRDSNESIKSVEEELNSNSFDQDITAEVMPVTKDIESLYKGVDIYYSTPQFERIPIENLGSGTKSWAVFSSYKAQLESIYRNNTTVHSIFLIEEPEAHIHPQAQMSLINTIKETKGQKIIATHSPYIINQYGIEEMVRVDCVDGDTHVFSVGDCLSREDILDIDVQCFRHKAEIMFASKVVFVEGVTEEMALPILFKHYFGKHPFDLGISFLSADGGGGKYKPYLNLCKEFNSCWYIFSDSEESIVKKLNSALKEVFNDKTIDAKMLSNITLLPDGQCYEDYLIENGFSKYFVEGLDHIYGVTDYLHSKVCKNNWDNIVKGKNLSFASKDEEEKAMLKWQVKNNKTELASFVAKRIVDDNKPNELPSKILELFEKLK